jgi:hypothetical protein
LLPPLKAALQSVFADEGKSPACEGFVDSRLTMIRMRGNGIAPQK